MKTQCQTIRLAAAIAAFLVVFALGSDRAAGQFIITEIIDANGDGAPPSRSPSTGDMK
jgi:hypothetical protein